MRNDRPVMTRSTLSIRLGRAIPGIEKPASQLVVYRGKPSPECVKCSSRRKRHQENGTDLGWSAVNASPDPCPPESTDLLAEARSAGEDFDEAFDDCVSYVLACIRRSPVAVTGSAAIASARRGDSVPRATGRLAGGMGPSADAWRPHDRPRGRRGLKGRGAARGSGARSRTGATSADLRTQARAHSFGSRTFARLSWGHDAHSAGSICGDLSR